MPKLHSYELRLQSERITHRYEGEEPPRFIAKKPPLSLANLLATASGDFKLLVKTEESIFQHGVHQRRLGAHGRESDPKVKELFWQRGDIQRPLIPGDSLGRHGAP